MSRLVREAVLDRDQLGGVLAPRTGVVAERAVGEGRFEAVDGPVQDYRRSVEVEDLPSERVRVHQTVEYRLAIPYWGWLFALPIRRSLARLLPDDRTPWWAPPDRLDARASSVLARLCAVSVVLGYLGTLLTQTITFAADEFGATKAAQGVVLASVRVDILIALPLTALADRRGRLRLLRTCLPAACLATAVGATVPSLAWLGVSQVPARGLTAVGIIVLAVIAAEEMPAGSRAYALSLVTVSASLGAGICVLALNLVDLGDPAWRLLYAAGLLWLPVAWRTVGRLPESRRFVAPHARPELAGHGRRFWLLATSAFLLSMFVTPASQFLNEFLNEERGFSPGRISAFTILTNVPGGIGIVVGGRLAERGRRPVGAVAVVGGVGATVLMYMATGWPLWAWSAMGALVGAATIPALSVYGPELFPTSMRGGANGVIAGLARAGSVVGLVATGFLADRFGELGPALALLAIGPLIVAVLVLAAYPETAHRELEELNPEDALPSLPHPV